MIIHTFLIILCVIIYIQSNAYIIPSGAARGFGRASKSKLETPVPHDVINITTEAKSNPNNTYVTQTKHPHDMYLTSEVLEDSPADYEIIPAVLERVPDVPDSDTAFDDIFIITEENIKEMTTTIRPLIISDIALDELTDNMSFLTKSSIISEIEPIEFSEMTLDQVTDTSILTQVPIVHEISPLIVSGMALDEVTADMSFLSQLPTFYELTPSINSEMIPDVVEMEDSEMHVTEIKIITEPPSPFQDIKDIVSEVSPPVISEMPVEMQVPEMKLLSEQLSPKLNVPKELALNVSAIDLDTKETSENVTETQFTVSQDTAPIVSKVAPADYKIASKVFKMPSDEVATMGIAPETTSANSLYGCDSQQNIKRRTLVKQSLPRILRSSKALKLKEFLIGLLKSND